MDLIESNFNATGRHPWELSRIASVKSMLNDKLKQSRNLRFLDFGSGDAFVATELVAAYPGAIATCVDLYYTEDIIAKIKNGYGSKSISFLKSVDALDPMDTPYDVVTMLDVLEHIEDPVRALKDLIAQGSFSPDTLFIVTVPAYNYLFTQHDTLLGHYTRYTTKAIARVLTDAGLRVDKTGYFNTCLLPIRFWDKISEHNNDKKKTETDIAWDKPKLLTKIVTLTMNLDAMANFMLNEVGLKPPGLSCYAIASLS